MAKHKSKRPKASGKPSFGGRKPTPSVAQSPRGRLVVGIHSAKEVLKVRPAAVLELYLRKGFEDNSDLKGFFDWAKQNKKPVKVEEKKFFDRICNTHQGLCLVVQQRPRLDYKDLAKSEKQVVVVLDGIEDPHNLGAILRTAWLTGAKALFVPQSRSTSLTPTAIKVASGGAEHVPVQEESNLGSTLKELKELGFWIYSLSHEAEKNLWQEELPDKVAWIIGSEGKGVRKPIARAADIELKIPQVDAEASFNASVAAAFALGETQRQFLSR